MTEIEQTAAFAFTAFNALRVISYIPQMQKIWNDRHGSEAVSMMTWTLFGLSHLSTVMYAIIAPGDYYMAAIFMANAVCCAIIVGLTRWSRLRRARAVADKPPPTAQSSVAVVR